MSDLKSMAAVDQNVQRHMAYLASSQLQNMIAVATNTALMAAKAAGVDLEDLGIQSDVLGSVAATIESSKNTFEYAAKLTKGVIDSAGAEKEMTRLTNVLTAISSKAGVPIPKSGMLAGGSIQGALMGKNTVGVVENGEAEYFHSGGSGQNVLFAPGNAGRIFNTSETMGLLEKGAGGGPGGGTSSPAISRTGGGEQTVLNITINAGTLDKGSFAKLLETEILDHIYK